MSGVRSLRRAPTALGPATPTSTPIYIDSDDNIAKMIPAGSGTTEVQLVDASSAQTLTNKAITTPTYTKKIETVVTTNIITAAESGTTFFLDLVTGFVSTLPAVTGAGMEFEFVIVTQPTNGSHTIVPASGTTIVGHVVSSDVGTDADFGTSGEGTITFVVSKAVKGDRVRLVSNGTNWYMTAFNSVFDAITLS